jgi:hypothetical protein
MFLFPESHGGAYPPLFKDEDSDDDDDKLAQDASRRAGRSGDSDLFSSVLGMIGGKKKAGAAAADDDSDIDEECECAEKGIGREGGRGQPIPTGPVCRSGPTFVRARSLIHIYPFA